MGQQIIAWFSATGPAATAAAVLAALAWGLFLYHAVLLSIIDIRSHLLPNRIVGPWFVAATLLLGAAAFLGGEPAMLLRMGVGSAALFAGYLLLHLLVPGGMGLGDVKLAAVLGLYLGFLSYAHLLWATVLAFFIGAGWSLVLLLIRRASLRTAVAFGPFMLVGGAVALFVDG